ncbi:hypothetical protein L6164_007695 [Bauhinia variegata]|uniref:Uncharacterized protein n=1 Tax=Bauhinia variegata TaxID=167791 RepID=A0ACB9PFJ4_BAUVA|nr:hypothetical protein L6164_007695 [Bauhinia variegata]
MGLLGRNFASKLTSVTKHLVARIAILKKQHQSRASYARSDAAELLNLGYHDRALLRVEHLIKEQNMLDVFVMIESYCKFLSQKAELLERNKECPAELKEATSSLIYACSRCGEMPELQKMREIFTSKFGKEFEAQAVELYKNNGVNSEMIQKLAARPAALEIRLKVLKNIADEIGVTLHLEQESTIINVNELNLERRQEVLESRKSSEANDFNPREKIQGFTETEVHGKELSDSNKERTRYKDITATAQEAFKPTAYGVEVNENSNQRATLDKVHQGKNSSSESEEVLPKNNNSFNTKESEERVAITQHAKPESRLSQIPRDNTKSSADTELVFSKYMHEDTKNDKPNKSNNSRSELPHLSLLSDLEFFVTTRIDDPTRILLRTQPKKYIF